MATTTQSRGAAAQPAGTIIGAGLSVEGEISGNEPVTVLGSVKGKISVTDVVIIDKGGIVEADVEASEIKVLGTVTGNLVASDRIDVATSARVVGDLRAPRIQIAEGAGFKGHIDMDV
jgi:cytoskeletal protein CcmA (bactofilin family)